MTFTLPPSLTTSYPPSQRVVRRAFMINICLTSCAPGEAALNAPPKFEQDMVKREVGENDVFVGIAGLKSLDMIALIGRDASKGRYKKAVLFDINEHQIAATKKTLDLIRENETADGFIAAFTKSYPDYLRPPAPGEPDYHAYMALTEGEKGRFYNAFGSSYQPHTQEQISKYMQRFKIGRDTNWLHPENYKYIRQLVLNDDIAVATMDLRDPERIATLARTLKVNGQRAGDVYISSAMDFADPHLRTDYYSKGSTVEQAKAFYDNLLLLADDKTGYISSQTSGSMPILQSYHLEHLDKATVQKARDAIPAHELPCDQQDYSMLINAGDMVWRLHSFPPRPAGERHPAQPRYFRVFSEMPSNNRAQLDEQIELIDKILAEKQGIKLAAPEVGKNTPDGDYFEYEKKYTESPYVQLSSKVFQLSPDATDSTVNELMLKLITGLGAAKRAVS